MVAVPQFLSLIGWHRPTFFPTILEVLELIVQAHFSLLFLFYNLEQFIEHGFFEDQIGLHDGLFLLLFLLTPGLVTLPQILVQKEQGGMGHGGGLLFTFQVFEFLLGLHLLEPMVDLSFDQANLGMLAFQICFFDRIPQMGQETFQVHGMVFLQGFFLAGQKKFVFLVAQGLDGFLGGGGQGGLLRDFRRRQFARVFGLLNFRFQFVHPGLFVL